MQGVRNRVVLALGLALIAVACSSSSGGPESPGSASTDSLASGATSATGTSFDASAITASRPTDRECADTSGSVPLTSTTSVTLERIHDADGITVDAAMYPHPDYRGNPWSQWGQGIIAPTGRYYSAIGDHIGADGNSYVYEYDPSTNALVLVTDVLSVADHNEGAFGYGKIHAQMALGPCDEVFFATYWGTRRGLAYDNGYIGDLLFHIDPYDRTLVNHGVLEEERGFPTMASAPGHGLLYTIGVQPDTNQGTFLVIDATTIEVVFSAPADPGFRSIGVDGDGAAYFSSSSGQLSRYDPETNSIVGQIGAPGSFIRAADTFSDGTIVGVMQGPETFFVISDVSLQPLDKALGYTTSVALSADGSEVFYLPGAHGSSWRNGAILKAVDTSTGTERDVIALADIVNDAFDVTLGGTYNMVFDRDSSRLYVGVNVDPGEDGGGFGEVALLVIGLP